MGDEDRNRQAARRLYEEGFNEGRLEVVDEVVDPDIVNHAAPPDAVPGIEGAKEVIRGVRRAAPEYHLAIHHVIAEGDLVVVHCTASTGPMQGEFLGVDVTGRSAEVPQAHVLRFRDGRIVEHWGVRQDLAAMRELGVVGDATSR